MLLWVYGSFIYVGEVVGSFKAAKLELEAC